MARIARPIAPQRQQAENDRRFVTALARGLEVLRCFGADTKRLSNKEISIRTGLPKATVSRLTFTLLALGYLERSSDEETYALDLPVLSLGFRVLSHFEIGRIAHRHMQAMADYASAAVSLGVRHGDCVIYVAHCRSTSPLTLGLDVGARLPLVTSIIGKAIISTLPEPERQRLLEQAMTEPDLVRFDVAGDVHRAMGEMAELGFAVSDAEAEIGAVAVTLEIGDGRERMGLNCGGPASSLSHDRLRRDLGPRLLETARGIERAIRGES